MPQSREYLRRGAEMVLGNPLLFLQIVVGFSAPAVAASWLVASVPFGPWWREPVLFVLNATTIVVAPVVFMMGVKACHRGERVHVGTLLRRAIPWLPRYVWTNAQTSIIFWLPMSIAITLKDAISHTAAMSAVAAGFTPLDIAAWLLLLGPMALYLHSRTLLAPFLAVHGDRPGTVATWQSWKESWQHLPLVLSTFVLACIPTAIPVGLIAFAFMNGAGGRPPESADALAPLLGVGLQVIRLSLVPAAYALYLDLEAIIDEDLPTAEPLPPALQPLLRFSGWCTGSVQRVVDAAHR